MSYEIPWVGGLKLYTSIIKNTEFDVTYTSAHELYRYSLESRQRRTYLLLVRYCHSLRSLAEQNLFLIKYVSQPVLLRYLTDSSQEPWLQTQMTSPQECWGALGFLLIPPLYYIWKCYRGRKGKRLKDANSLVFPQMNYDCISGPNSRLVSDIGTKENSSG